MTTAKITAPASAIAAPAAKPDDWAPSGSAGQTFLVGETLYLRALEPSDAKRAAAWRPQPFPVPAEKAEEQLKELIANQQRDRTVRLLALRRADDLPVGMVQYQAWDGRTADVSLHVDPGFGPDRVVGWKAELLALTVPWLQHERDMMAVWADLDGSEAPVIAAAARLGMRPSFRLREALWRDGGRHDFVTYEALHPGWLERLGDPGPGIDHAQVPDDPARTPAAPPRPVFGEFDGDPPRNAVMVGPRVYLRPIEVEDGRAVADLSRRETETFFDNGRGVRGAFGFAEWTKKLAADDPPGWVRFAVVLREDDTYIGSLGISDIDYVHRTAETESFMDRPDYRGGGYGTEGKQLLLAYAFERLGLHTVRSYVWGPNTRSQAALRKQGYRDAGRLHWTGIKDAQYTHDCVFDLLATEWRSRQGR